jgi:hypothetical protein
MQENNIEQAKYHENIECTHYTTSQHTSNGNNDTERFHRNSLSIWFYYTDILVFVNGTVYFWKSVVFLQHVVFIQHQYKS